MAIDKQAAWWNWPVAEVRQVAHLLCSTDITPFVDYLKQRAIEAQ